MNPINDRPAGRKLPTRLMCERYSVVDRTINRWEATGIIPQAERINGRKYWDEEKVERRDRERGLAQTHKRQSKSMPASLAIANNEHPPAATPTRSVNVGVA
jgi:DNA-binding transcriptional MerR regulator